MFHWEICLWLLVPNKKGEEGHNKDEERTTAVKNMRGKIIES